MDDNVMQPPPFAGTQIDKLAAALAKAQSGLTSPEKNREVSVNGTTKSGKAFTYTFKYTTLDRIIEHVRGPLTANGIWFTQTLEAADGGRYKLVTTLMHDSGQSIRSETPLLVGEGGNQAFGSALTYMRRYALTAMLGIAADEDDDANRADGNTIKNAQGKTRTPDLSDVRGDFHQPPNPTPIEPAADIQIAGPFTLYDLQGEAMQEYPDVRTFLTELGTRMKDNAEWWNANHHTIEWMEKEYRNQRVPGSKEYIETWTRKLRKFAKAGQAKRDDHELGVAPF